MKKNFLMIILVGLTLAFFIPRQSLAVDSGWESLAVPTSGGVISVRLIRINLSSADLAIRSITSSSGELLSAKAPTTNLKSYVDQVGGFAGVNGSYFCPSDYATCAGIEGSYYYLWYNSVTGQFSNSYQNQFNQGGVIAFDGKNNFYFYNIPHDWPGEAQFESEHGQLQALISNGPTLVYQGNMTVTESMLDDKQRTVKSNRSGIGFKNGQVYIGVASSATVMDLGRAMDAMGMDYALNLDGGGSSVLYYNGQYGVGPGRNIPNALAFIDTDGDVENIAPGTSFDAFSATLRSGFTVSSGNVLGDALDEVIIGTAPGLAPQLRIFDGDGNLASQFFAFDSTLRNGVSTSACDVDGDGMEEIVAAQGRGGWPLVKIFKGDGTVVNNGFYVLDGKFIGGISLSCGDIDGNGIYEVIVAAKRGGGPHVLVYDLNGKTLANFMAYATTFRGGINVATADIDGDSKDEIITGPEFGAPHIQIFKIKTHDIVRLSPGFYAFGSSYRDGVSVAGVDTDGDGIKELLVGVGENSQPMVKVYNIREELQKQFYVYSTTFLGGVNLSGGDVDGDGKEELISVPRSNGGPQVKVVDVDEV